MKLVEIVETKFKRTSPNISKIEDEDEGDENSDFRNPRIHNRVFELSEVKNEDRQAQDARPQIPSRRTSKLAGEEDRFVRMKVPSGTRSTLPATMEDCRCLPFQTSHPSQLTKR